MKKFVNDNQLIIMEGAVIERLRRSNTSSGLHPSLINAPLIYTDKGQKDLSDIYNSYIEIAKHAELPFIMCAPTWRANRQRVVESGFPLHINIDAVNFMKKIRDDQKEFADHIKIGGIVGCKNDCYKPEEALSVSESLQFHSWQIDQLVKSGVDFIIAETLPQIDEAQGISQAIGQTNTPYIISFVISRKGLILDGTPLTDAIYKIDQSTTNKPLGYAINCAYPTFLRANHQPKQLFKRLVGYIANASSLDQCDLDGSETLESDDLTEWGNEMLKLNRHYNVKILGGCCGTDEGHINYIARN
jgi:S-methylmethionine-dependent homocysteine/selenocysteine methylase